MAVCWLLFFALLFSLGFQPAASLNASTMLFNVTATDYTYTLVAVQSISPYPANFTITSILESTGSIVNLLELYGQPINLQFQLFLYWEYHCGNTSEFQSFQSFQGFRYSISFQYKSGNQLIVTGTETSTPLAPPQPFHISTYKLPQVQCTFGTSCFLNGINLPISMNFTYMQSWPVYTLELPYPEISIVTPPQRIFALSPVEYFEYYPMDSFSTFATYDNGTFVVRPPFHAPEIFIVAQLQNAYPFTCYNLPNDFLPAFEYFFAFQFGKSTKINSQYRLITTEYETTNPPGTCIDRLASSDRICVGKVGGSIYRGLVCYIGLPCNVQTNPDGYGSTGMSFHLAVTIQE